MESHHCSRRWSGSQVIFSVRRKSELVQGRHRQGNQRACHAKIQSLPQGPTWNQVQLLLQACRTNRPADIRARPILMLFALYALRSSEVAGFGWTISIGGKENSLLSVPNAEVFSNTRFRRQVGSAIQEYITKVRPRCTCKHLFVTLQSSVSANVLLLDLHDHQPANASRRNGFATPRATCAAALMRDPSTRKGHIAS